MSVSSIGAFVLAAALQTVPAPSTEAPAFPLTIANPTAGAPPAEDAGIGSAAQEDMASMALTALTEDAAAFPSFAAATPPLPGLQEEPPAESDPPPDQTDAGTEQGRLRLRLLEAQLLAETGRIGEARRRFEALRVEMPTSPEPLSGAANIALRTGRWREAMAYYQNALLLDPQNFAILLALQGISRSAAPRLRAEFEYRETKGAPGAGRATAYMGGISGQQTFSDGWRLGFVAEVAQVEATQVQRRNGATGPFSGTRERGELFLQRDRGDGLVLIGSIFFAQGSLGAGLRAERTDDRGATTLRVEYRRPNWDFFESLIEFGTRDRVAVGRRHLIATNLTGRLEIGANSYGFRDDRSIASTFTAAGELRLGNLANIRSLSISYILDGEYLLRGAEQMPRNGQLFGINPLRDREVHALALGYSGVRGISAAEGIFSYEATGGYAVDRYGKAGPIVYASMGYLLNSFEARLRGSFVENVGRSRGSTTVLGASVTWFF
jgi:hypothetical protein